MTSKSLRTFIDEYERLIAEAVRIGESFGLNGMDALHIAAALLSQSDEFITAERPTSPFSRVQGISIVSIA